MLNERSENGGVIVVSWWHFGGGLVASWWRHGGVVIIYALQPLNFWPNRVAIWKDIATHGSNLDFCFTRKMLGLLILSLCSSLGINALPCNNHLHKTADLKKQPYNVLKCVNFSSQLSHFRWHSGCTVIKNVIFGRFCMKFLVFLRFSITLVI